MTKQLKVNKLILPEIRQVRVFLLDPPLLEFPFEEKSTLVLYTLVLLYSAIKPGSENSTFLI